jgi:hypothetical protein
MRPHMSSRLARLGPGGSLVTDPENEGASPWT